MKCIAFLALAALAASSPAIAEDAFPVSIEHALGTTTIESKPVRVVTWGWSAQDVVLDLGVTPVGMPFFAYGGGDDGILPWTEAAITEGGLEMPTVLPNNPEAPLEAIAALDPDVIIAPYSGITPDEYELLSAIAPVVAYPNKPWLIRWQDVVTLTGQALGESEAAATLIAETEAFLAQQVATQPAIAGTVFANVVNRNDGQVSVRIEGDPRVQLFADVGMVPAPPVDGSALVSTGISYLVSYENFDRIPADMLLSFFDNEQAADAFIGLDLIKTSPLVAKGAYTRLFGEDLTMSVSGAITPMSLRWGFPQVLPEIGRAASAASAE
ncbi:iron complex transport system substrate-binding protein [Devosia lucknowensis]|uniref:Iron complex transport system substrate-binding protein n=1 Tax=Devosia lucknowensis TaxID=1096929 RepID=A0A1Y6ELK3_9HYPH|nr:ABC transporter substrate-binding protein [Devosia lucknowensis]SMQ63266.1 iron complex transport system substrate-binding protein [Devosia lucknowensis]